jgi:transglutaminase-like putative cysteine protease
MQLKITHDTCYDYAPAVDNAQHMCYLQPGVMPTQALMGHLLHVEPEPAQLVATQDVYGNTRHFFCLQNPHTQLRVTSQSWVDTRVVSAPDSSIRWDAVRDQFRYHAGARFDAAADFVFASPYVPRHGDFAAYARPSFKDGVPLALAARDLMRRIHTEFKYESQSTQVNTPALQALAQRKGVCQDFAHIMIACLRALGLPARYVSGYLLTQPPPGQPRLVGSDASHAWVSVYMPDLTDLPPAQRWLDFDPTNNREGWGSPGEDYVTLATGRDFADVSPMRGVIHGGASHTLTVGVTVEPLDEHTGTELPSKPDPAPLSTQEQSQSQAFSPLVFSTP